MASSFYRHGIVFIDGDSDGYGGCWSALGLAPGFRGSATKKVEEFGAPPTWQVISLAEGCGGNTRNTVQHEVQHALGRFHEFSRPDRDEYIQVSQTAFNAGAWKNRPSEFTSYGFPLEIGSSMMYCSFCFTFSDSPDFMAKDGTTWGNLKGMTTMDALKTEAKYCPHAPTYGYKNKVTCPKKDLGGVYLPVFTDRLCDNVDDCPGATDEDGSMFECAQGGKTPLNNCCREFIIRDDRFKTATCIYEKERG